MRRGACLAAFVVLGCTGSVTTPDAIGDEPTTCELCVGDSNLQRLTRLEYEGSVRGLLGDTIADDVRFDYLPPDGSSGPFKTNAFLLVDDDGVEAYRAVAEAAGNGVAANAEEVLGCAMPADATCIDAFIDRVGATLYRRALRAEERTAYRTLYDDVSAAQTETDAVRLVVVAALQSPYFLYRVEVGEPSDDADVFRLTGAEIATRLSYFLWKAAPDRTLRAAAEAGELDTPEGIEMHARRMLEDSRAEASIVQFHLEWLGVEELETHAVAETHADTIDPLREPMHAEIEALVLEVFRSDARLETLLTSRRATVTPDLARFYGVEPPSEDATVRIELPAGERSGVLTRAGLIATHTTEAATASIHRGRLVREQFLCQAFPPPPDVDGIIAPDPTLSTREQIDEKTSPSACAGCHRLMNPLGHAFGHYDVIGGHQSMDGEHVIDATGDVADSDIDETFDGAIELSSLLARSEDVHRCVARQWMRYAIGREDRTLDRLGMNDAFERYVAADYDLRELIVAITTTDAFRYRRLPSP